jgi:hypothetical protein
MAVVDKCVPILKRDFKNITSPNYASVLNPSVSFTMIYMFDISLTASAALPLEILREILFYAVIVRGLGRGMRLRLVCSK